MLEKIQILLQYLLPKFWITHIAGLIASWQGGWVTRYAILLFVNIYKVNMKECDQPNVTNYKTFNEFFTRKLNITARPIDSNPSTIVVPADGIITQIGIISSNNHIFQIKNSFHRLDELLAGHDKIVNYFRNGNFSIIYIPPKNCHRIHMPCTGILQEVLYIPGQLFSVNPKIIKHIPNIFSRNERVICIFKTDFGYMAQILVGAAIVGSIETTWSGPFAPPRTGIIKHWHYETNNTNKTSNNSIITLSKGQEMGLFKLGSTVINLFDNQKVCLNNQLQPNDITYIGMPLAKGRNTLLIKQ